MAFVVYYPCEAWLGVNKRKEAVNEFNSHPAHRWMLLIMVVVVLLTAVGCLIGICSLPTKYCNYLIPAILASSVVSLIIIARLDTAWITGLLQYHALICSQCGCPTILRPDEVSLRVADRAFGTEICYHGDADLSGESLRESLSFGSRKDFVVVAIGRSFGATPL